MQVLLATTNRGKIAELTEALSEYGLQVVGLQSLADKELETGSTFEENALLKARYYHHQTGLVTVADDSGLEVDALGFRPGVHSARFAGPEATDGQRIDRLLAELVDIPEQRRKAQFVSVAAIVWADGEQVFRGTVAGVILSAPRGSGGFGYDPVFFYPPLGRTFAELTRDEKWEVSHRGRAFRLLSEWLATQQRLVDEPA